MLCTGLLLKKHHKLAHLPADFGVLDETDSQALVREILKDIKVVGKERFDLDRLLNLVQRTRAGEISGTRPLTSTRSLLRCSDRNTKNAWIYLGSSILRVYYSNLLNCLRVTRNLKKQIQAQYDQIMVDEFQDTNQVQMRLIHDLIDERRNITVVGDDDQSIYGWRGAEVKNILQFPQNYKPCRVIKLERNYRSQPAILNLANAVISK